MPDETRTYAQLTGTDFADNAPAKAINAQKLRNLVKTLEQIVRALNTTERGQAVLRALADQPGLTVFVSGAEGKGVWVKPEADFIGKYLIAVSNTPGATRANWFIDASGSMYTFMYFAMDPNLLFGNHTTTEFGAHMAMFRADVNGCVEFMTAPLDGNYFTAYERFDGLHVAHVNGDGSYELVRRGAGYVLTDESTGDNWRLKMVGGVVTPEKLSDFASTGTAAVTPVHVTDLVTALGGAGNVTAIWARDARMTALEGRCTVWAEARATAGRQLDGVLAYVNPGGDPLSAALGRPRWDGTRPRFFHGQRFQTALLAEFRAAAVRTIAVVGRFYDENPDTFPAGHIANIIDAGTNFDFGLLVRNNLIQTQMFNGSSMNWVSSGIAASKGTRRCAILTRSAVDFSIQVPPNGRVTTALAEPAFAAATGRLLIGGMSGTYITGEIDAVVALPIAASQAQADAIIAWAAAQYGSAS